MPNSLMLVMHAELSGGRESLVVFIEFEQCRDISDDECRDMRRADGAQLPRAGEWLEYQTDLLR